MGKCRTLAGKERVVHSLRPWNENVQLRELWISICVAACFGLVLGTRGLCARTWRLQRQRGALRDACKSLLAEDPEWAGGVCVSRFPTAPQTHGLIPSSQTVERREPVGGLNLPLVPKPRADRSGGSRRPQPGDSGALPPCSRPWTRPRGQQRLYPNLPLPTAVTCSPKFAFQNLGGHQNHWEASEDELLGPTPLQPGPRRSEDQLNPRRPRALGTRNAGLSPRTDATHTHSPGIFETCLERLPEDIHLFFPGSFAFPS